MKSKQGTQFRMWATNVLKDYLLKGYAINQRINRIENNVENLSEKVIHHLTGSHPAEAFMIRIRKL